jgi:hypothetical protein
MYWQWRIPGAILFALLHEKLLRCGRSETFSFAAFFASAPETYNGAIAAKEAKENTAKENITLEKVRQSTDELKCFIAGKPTDVY